MEKQFNFNYFNYRHFEEYTPLHIAVYQGNTEIVKTLIDKRKNSIDINATTILIFFFVIKFQINF